MLSGSNYMIIFYNHRELYVDKTHLNYHSYEYISRIIVDKLRHYNQKGYI